MSEAIKLRKRFSHKALFHVLAITVNYHQQEKETYGKGEQKKSGFIHFHTVFFFPLHSVGILIIREHV